MLTLLSSRCRVFAKLLADDASIPKFWSGSNHLLHLLAAKPHLITPEAQYNTYADQVIGIVRMWPPEYIPHSSPFLGCFILGPAAMHLRVTLAHRRQDLAAETAAATHGVGVLHAASLEEELLRLVLSHIAQFWKFGSLLLGNETPIFQLKPLEHVCMVETGFADLEQTSPI